MTRIVVSADDFGLCAEVNDAICLLHDRGIVQRTSVMVNTDCFDASVDALHRRPALAVAIHLNLTDGRPVLPPQHVPTLVDASGCFPGGRHYGVSARIAVGRLRTREIREEWRAQIARARGAGLKLQQLNAHGHLHLLPPLHGVVVDLMREFDIPEVRLVRAFDSPRGILLHVCSMALMRRLHRNGLSVVAPDRTIGLRSPGARDPRIHLGDLAGDGVGTIELIVHPSKGDNAHHRRWGYAGDDVLHWLLDESGRRA